MPEVLEGIRALDFSRFLAGPYCGALLAMMGAEVIRVEPPGGEIDRELGPFAPNGQSMYPWVSNWNKESITLDLRLDKGRDILYALAEKVDIVIEAFLPKMRDSLGLSYDALSWVNPRIILVSVSGFGQTGPYAQRGAFDAIAQGMSGLMTVTGFPDGPPTKMGTAVIDHGTGVYAALGAMFALYQRQKTGKGQAVDASLLDTAISFMETVFLEYAVLGDLRSRIGNRRRYSAPTDMYRAKDGYVNISISTDTFWRRFTKLIGRQDLTDNPRFNSNRMRFKSHEDLNGITADWVSGRTVAEAIATLESAGIPAGPVYSVPEVLNDPHIRERKMIVELEHPGVGKAPIAGPPIRLSETPGRIHTRAPGIGEHNEELYGSLLGYTKEQVAALRREKVV